ncbi:fumarylacetoacetate hydrolase family protein [Sphingomonas sp. AOB5]|uniref:fumarylacetoacetate hydrolase family protein n=1 Tax=Sphingomonas sp. AOB5 TaxID=3034017 RepID=UPI0023F6FF45|nr:fumarylacetoacetate hydrolase family protein [Sphingomonas sp. AOB5]MDF7775358.1 fumarylacetoacetate hydrolase family protein [Sphingomonas sp. AOB5]
MKLVRYGEMGAERPGLIDGEGRLRSVAPLVTDWTPELLSPDALAILGAVDIDRLPLVPGTPRLGVPVAGLRQIFAVGLNYVDHSVETGLALTTHPMLFAKSIASLCGANDDVAIPPGAAKLDWEIELAIVIGRTGRHLSEAEALSHIGGLCLSIEFSERAWQMEMGGQHGKGKSYDRFTPLGPWLTTMDEVGDPQALAMQLEVNDAVRQRGSSSDMVFAIAAIVSHISQFQTLLPGDVIQTGTPAGVAYGAENPVYLKPGDVVTCRADKLGTQRHRIVTEQV